MSARRVSESRENLGSGRPPARDGRYYARVAVFVVRAAAIGDQLTDELCRLLSRAYTDEPHLATYPPELLQQLASAIAAVQNGPATMPREWLRRFPTIRNLRRNADQRLDSVHFLHREGGVLAGHVALFEQQFVFGGTERVSGGYIEDVATEPARRGAGIATGLLTEAVKHARAAGMEILGLGTSIPEFYGRIAWRRWEGTASHENPDGSEAADAGEMVLALSPAGAGLIGRHAGKHMFRRTREPA